MDEVDSVGNKLSEEDAVPEAGEEYWGMPANTYCMLLHLSQLTSIVAPGLGLLLPVLMWVLNKDKPAKRRGRGDWVMT